MLHRPVEGDSRRCRPGAHPRADRCMDLRPLPGEARAPVRASGVASPGSHSENEFADMSFLEERPLSGRERLQRKGSGDDGADL